MRAIIFFFAILYASTSFAADPEADLSLTLCSSVAPPSLGGAELPVYCGSANTRKPFIGPYLRIDWSALDTAVKAACDHQNGVSVAHVLVPFELMSQRVEMEARIALTADPLFQQQSGGSATVGGALVPLFAHPYGSIVIFSGDSDTRKDRYHFPRDGMRLSSTGRLAQVNFQPTNVPPFKLSDTCNELQRIVDDRDLQGEMYFQFITVQKNVFTAHLTQFIESSAYNKIFDDQQQSGKVTVSTSGGGSDWGLNVGPFSAGSSHNGGETSTTDTRHRYISSNVMLDAASKYTSSFDATSWNEFNKEAPATQAEMAKQLTDHLLRNAESVVLTVKSDGDKLQELALAGMTRALSADESQLLMSAVPAGVFSSTNDHSGSVGYAGFQVSGAEKKTITVPQGPTMTFEQKNGQWIPTSITLQSVTKVSATQNQSVSYTEARARAGEGFAMLPLQNIYQVQRQSTDVQPSKDSAKLLTQRPETFPALPAMSAGSMPDMAFCVPGFTLTQRPNNIMAALHTFGPNATSSSRMLWTAPPNVPRCPTDTEAPNCVVPYGVCYNAARSVACIVNDPWLHWFMGRANATGEPPNIHGICD